MAMEKLIIARLKISLAMMEIDITGLKIIPSRRTQHRGG